MDLQVLEFVEVRTQFFLAQLYNLPAQPLAREESKIRSKKFIQLPFERCPVLSLLYMYRFTFPVKRYRTPLGLQVLEFAEVWKQFFVAQLHNLPAPLRAREEWKIRLKKIRQLPLERREDPL